jgi:hypothetical protein
MVALTIYRYVQIQVQLSQNWLKDSIKTDGVNGTGNIDRERYILTYTIYMYILIIYTYMCIYWYTYFLIDNFCFKRELNLRRFILVYHIKPFGQSEFEQNKHIFKIIIALVVGAMQW